jgi:hypothetical protein
MSLVLLLMKSAWGRPLVLVGSQEVLTHQLSPLFPESGVKVVVLQQASA